MTCRYIYPVKGGCVMPENQHREDAKRALYETMRTEELQQLLREDASKPLGEGSDTDALLCMMEVLAERRNEQNKGKTPQEAQGSFKTNYCTEKRNSFDSESNAASGKYRIGGRWKRDLIAAAAAICIIVAGNSITARALGVDLWQIIAKWTQETFHWEYAGQIGESSEPSLEYTNPCSGLQEILESSEISARLVPTWIPDGYVEIDVRMENTPAQRRFAACYQLEDMVFKIRIAEYLISAPVQVEQSDSLIEIYTAKNISYYIFENNQQFQVMWIVENYECCITGSLSISEIKAMIDSI